MKNELITIRKKSTTEDVRAAARLADIVLALHGGASVGILVMTLTAIAQAQEVALEDLLASVGDWQKYFASLPRGEEAGLPEAVMTSNDRGQA